MTVGEAMREARKKAGLTQAELATITGINPSILSKYEHDGCVPRLDIVEMLADTLQISIDEYVGHGKNQSFSPNADGMRIMQHQAKVAGMKELGEKLMDLITDTIKAERGALK